MCKAHALVRGTDGVSGRCPHFFLRLGYACPLLYRATSPFAAASYQCYNWATEISPPDCIHWRRRRTLII